MNVPHKLTTWITVFVVVTGIARTEETFRFKCFQNHCTRGEQYCSEDIKRCGNCSNEVKRCGTSDLPRDCDAYCMSTEADKIRISLNTTLTLKRELEEEVERLRFQLKQTRQGHKYANNETHQLKISSCQNGRHRWFFSNVILGCIIVVIALVLLYLLLMRRNKKTDKPQNIKYTHETEISRLVGSPDDTVEKSEVECLADSGVSLEDISDGGAVINCGEQDSDTIKKTEIDTRRGERKTSHEHRAAMSTL